MSVCLFYPFLMACVPTSNFVHGEASGSAGRCGKVSASSRSESHRITRSDFFCTPLFPAFVFYFSCRCEWSVALGINDMTRDTLLLEFSQVRATPIEEARVRLCSASCRKQESPFLFSSAFFCCCSFNMAEKERWTQKSLLKEIWRWARGRQTGIFCCPRERVRERGNRFSSVSRKLSVAPGLKVQVPAL